MKKRRGLRKKGRETAEAIDRELSNRVFRYVNDQDPVPKPPTLSLLANGLAHCQKEIVLGIAAAAPPARPWSTSSTGPARPRTACCTVA